jgi:hypothetical protein
MEDKASIAVAATAAGALIGVLCKFALDFMTLRRTNKTADRKDALEEIYRLYNESNTEKRDLRERNTTLVIENERMKGTVMLLKERLRDHEIDDDVTDNHPPEKS